MTIAKGKIRKHVTFVPEDFEYLEKLADEKSKTTKGLVTASHIIEDLIESDRKIRGVFESKREKK